MDIELKNSQDRLKEITDTFNLFSDPIDILSYLVDLGKKSHNLDEHEKNEDNLILGCTSKAWVIVSNKENDKYVIETDSDSHIVSGLLFLLSLSINYNSRDYINRIIPNEILGSIGLEGSITSQRTNGLISAVNTIKSKIS